MRQDKMLFMIAVTLMGVAVVRATDDTPGGASVWFVLAAVMVVLGMAQRAGKRGGRDAG